MPFTNYTNIDFDQIKTSIKDYLRSNSDFSDFDFEGSNFSVLIDALAYNTYITAFNANMAVNESFIESATLRENVVSLARNVGYVPISKKSAISEVTFSIKFNGESQTVTLKAGLICVGNTSNSSFVFSLPEDIVTTSPLDSASDILVGPRTATFNNLKIYQGTLSRESFTVDTSLDQRFVLNNISIDTSTLVVRVKGPADTTSGKEYRKIDSITTLDSNSEIYFIQEVKDEKYELLFGDGIFGKALETGSVIDVSYIITDGKDSNGASVFSFSGNARGGTDEVIQPSNTVTITTTQKAQGGAAIESLRSVKYFAPRLYSSQYRAVTASDYETIVKLVYPESESVAVVGGEELDPPRFGEVQISIKPKNSLYISEFNKQQILANLKQYSLAGIRQSIVDLEILSIEYDTFVYYNSSKVVSVNDLKSLIGQSLNDFAASEDLNNFGGRFKYSKFLNEIDSTNTSITSNITRIKIRRDLRASLNRDAQYELCFGNRFHVSKDGKNIKSTGFNINGISKLLYMTDTPNDDLKTGVISFVAEEVSDNFTVLVKNAGTVNYVTGEIILSTTNIVGTQISGGIIEVQAFPESNDIIGLTNLFVVLATDKSTINMVKDTITSGEQVSGLGFPVTSSYSNGKLTR
jgi:hypothetical protein